MSNVEEDGERKGAASEAVSFSRGPIGVYSRRLAVPLCENRLGSDRARRETLRHIGGCRDHRGQEHAKESLVLVGKADRAAWKFHLQTANR